MPPSTGTARLTAVSQARMINDLLDLSRILSGKMHITPEAVDPMLPLVLMLDHWKSVRHGTGDYPEREQRDRLPDDR